MKTDIQIAQENNMEPIEKIARKAKIDMEYVDFYGKYKGKIDLKIFDKIDKNKDGKLILVTAINPTKAGEGKSTTTVGLCDALSSLNKMVIGALREPSLGPVFGVKGGATGGGYSQVVPMEDINLHFNGDIHAVTTANNLICAAIDNHLYHGNALKIDPEKVVFKRAMDMNDRALRDISVAQNDKKAIQRHDGFNISVASEIMAILCLSTSLQDFKQRVEKIVIGYNLDKQPITVKDLQIAGAVTMIIKEAIKPNLVQTLEKTPILIHGGPFANIAHGCNSIIATKMALKLADFVVTEAGFGADLGAQKFMDIKCPTAKIAPDVVVIVATIRALKLHGGVPVSELTEENIEALSRGIENLEKHVETIRKYHVPVIVSINRFDSDTMAELQWLQKWCFDHNVEVALNEAWGKGGLGAQKLAEKVVKACENEKGFVPLLINQKSLTDKIETIAKEVYGATSVEYSEKVIEQLEDYRHYGWDNLMVCMAKNQYSLTDDPKKLGRPKDFNIHIRELRISAGAGFVVALTSDVMTMPGLPKEPAANKMGIDEKGNMFGLF
jgi:formate--tetrahydrofolate ligase